MFARSSRGGACAAALVIAFLLTSASAASANVVHRFKFDGSLADYMGGTAASVGGTEAYTTGAFGQGISLDGSTQVSLGDAMNSTDSAGAGDFTLSATIKTTQSNAWIVSNRNDNCGGGPGWISLELGGGKLGVEVRDSPNNNYFTIPSSGAALDDNSFHRVALMRTGSTLSLWQDGANVGSATVPGDLRSSIPLQLGYVTPNCAASPFAGVVDEVRVEDSYDPTAADPELFATYLGDGNALDTTSGENGTWAGTEAYTTDRNSNANSAFSFDGNSSVSAPAAAGDFGANDWTVSQWVKVPSGGGPAEVITTRPACNSGGFDVRLHAPDPVDLEVWYSGGYMLASSPVAVDDDTWHQLTLTKSGSTVSVGVDGISRGTATVSGSLTAGAANLSMADGGCVGSGPTQRLTGAMDDVTLVNGAAAPLVTTAASISGTQQEGQTLTANAAFAGTSPTVTYDWERCDGAGGACTTPVGINSTYVPGASDVRYKLKLTVTATNDAGSQSTSAMTGRIAPATPAATPRPQILTSSLTPDTAYNANTNGEISAQGGADMRGAAFDTAGNLFVPDLEPNKLHGFTPSGTDVNGFPISLSAGGPGPMDVEIDKDGTIWVLRWDQTGASVLEKRDATGSLLNSYTLTGTVGMQGVGSDPATGVLYLTNQDALYRFDPSAGSPAPVAIATGLGDARDVAVGQDGTVYVDDRAGSEVDEFDAAGVSLGTFATGGNGPRHSQLTTDGVLWFATEANTAEAWSTGGTQLVSIPAAVHGVTNGAWWAGTDSSGRVYVDGYDGLRRLVVSTRATTEQVALAVDPNLVLYDAGTSNLSQATVTLATNFQGGEDQLGYTGTLPGSVAADTSTPGTIVFSGTATVAQYQALLRTVTYKDTSDAPNTATRTAQITVEDSASQTSPTYSRSLTVTPVDDAPVVTPTGSALGFTEGDAAKAVDPGVGVSDADSATMVSAQVKLTDPQPGDVLGYTTTNGVSGVVNGAKDTVTLSGSGTKADYQAALRAVTFFNGSDDPSAADRHVSFTVNDGSLDSSAVSRAVAVTPVDDAPALALTTAPLSYTEGDAATVVDPAAAATDVDDANLESAVVKITNAKDGDELVYSTTGGITGALNAAKDTLTLTGHQTKAAWNGALQAVRYRNTRNDLSLADRTVSFVVNDGDHDSAAVTRTIKVSPRAPVNTTPPAISGEAKQDAKLTATSGEWSGTRPLAVTLRWQRCDTDGNDCADISGATGADYTVAAADVGKRLRVVATADNPAPGTVEQASAATAAIAATGPIPGPKVTGGPSKESSDHTATFTWTGVDGAKFACSLDGGKFFPCTSPTTLKDLAAGDHTFKVVQVDPDGRVSEVTAYAWKIVDSTINATVPGGNDVNGQTQSVELPGGAVGSGCELDHGSLQSCEVDAFADVSGARAVAAKRVLIGTGRRTFAKRGVQKAIVRVRLNKLGRALLKRHPRGLAITFVVTGHVFDSSKVLRDTREVRVLPRVVLLVAHFGMFDALSAHLDTATKRYLRRLKPTLKGAAAIRCEGHTSDSHTHSEAELRRLGLERARAVCSYLKAMGFRAKLSAKSYGSKRPIASNATPRGERLNQRVELRVTRRS